MIPVAKIADWYKSLELELLGLFQVSKHIWHCARDHA
jgi:hypothetical protein